MARLITDPRKVLYKGPLAQVASIDVDAAATRLVAGDWKGTVTLWNLGDPKPRWHLGVDTARCQAVAFGGARVFVTTASGRVVALDAETGEAIAGVDSQATCNGHDRLLVRGDLVVCFGDARNGSGYVTALDATTFAPRWQRTVGELGRGADDAVVYLIDRTNSASKPRALRAVSLADGTVRDEREYDLLPVGFDPPRSLFAVGTPEFTEFRPLDALALPAVRAPLGAWTAEPARFSPDGRWFAVAEGRSVAFCEVRRGQVHRSTVKHTQPVGPLRWSPDGTVVFSGAWDRTVRVHPVPEGLRDG